jgi:Type I phosphodiesterase / nucleotide pyrophosphatase
MRAPLAALALLLAACGQAAEPAESAARPKVAILCADGASFTVLDPLLAAGKLPNIAGLIERGARCVLQSADPPKASPVLWATIFTGASKERHGILSFTVVEPDGRTRIYASTDRKLAALWNLVDARGGSAGVVGNLNTWPAEPVNGYVVSDRFARGDYGRDPAERAVSARVTHPEALLEQLRPLLPGPDAPTRDELARLGTFSDAEWEALKHGNDDDAELRNGLLSLRFGWTTQQGNLAAGLHLLQSQPQPDLFIVFLELTDRVGHHFWHAYRPEDALGGAEAVPAEWRERWSNIVPGAYEVLDEAVGELLARLGPDTTVFIVSDHGMQGSGGNGGSPDEPSAVGGSGKHHRDGVLIAAGPAIRRQGFAVATIWDVAPTVLAALGLRGSEQFEGRVLSTLLDPRFVAAHPQGAPLADPASTPAEAPDGLEAEYLEQLQAFGYVGGDGRDR